MWMVPSITKPRAGSGKADMCTPAWEPAEVLPSTPKWGSQLSHRATAAGHNYQPPHTWSGELGADSWREADSRGSVALGAVFHATGPTPFHRITTDHRQETKCASLGHQEVSVHPTSTSSWPFIAWWNSLPRVPLLQPSYPQAESVAKARLWLPPGPAPRERSAWKLC